MRKFLVERRPDVFDTVTADWLDIKSGALWFYRQAMSPTKSLEVIYAAGQWISVVAEDDQ
jgi:hypothetical protein